MKLVFRVVLSAVAYFVGVVLTRLFSDALGLPGLPAHPGATQQRTLLLLALAVPLLSLSLVPLALGIGGRWVRRWLTIAFVLFVCVGLNTVIEWLVFTQRSQYASPWMSIYFLIPTASAAAVLVLPLRRVEVQPMARYGLAGWMWRVFVAWLAFPMIYLVFGMCVTPFVSAHYRAGDAGLVIPPMSIILLTQMLRSVLFLASSLVVISVWSQSRLRLILAMGLAQATMVGFFGLVQGYWLSPMLRLAHGIEITADSFAYAAVLALLFVDRSPTAAEPTLRMAAVKTIS